MNDATSITNPVQFNIRKQIFNLPYTDAGNADAFALLKGSDFRYVHSIGWFRWDGSRWQFDTANKVVVSAAYNLSNTRVKIIVDFEKDLQRRAKLLQEAQRLQNIGRIKCYLEIATSIHPFSTTVDKLDSHVFLLSYDGGTLNLLDGNKKNADKADLITRLTGVHYEPKAHAPRWEHFLEEVFVNQFGQPDNDLINYIKRALGYSITGDTSEQCLFLLTGSGQNGKSTFLRAVQYVLGDYSGVLNFDSLLVKSGANAGNDIAALRGKRFVTGVESNAAERLDEAKVKRLTGQDTISVRYLYREFFNFEPTFKIWLACNEKPIIRGTDEAIWRRFRIIPFNASFPESNRDKNLIDELKAEAPGILAWIVEGSLEWRKVGLGSCKQIDEAVMEYRGEQDTFAEFLQDHLRQKSGYFITNKEFMESYSEWAKLNGLPLRDQVSLSKELRKRGYQLGKNTRNQRGIRDVELI